MARSSLEETCNAYLKSKDYWRMVQAADQELARPGLSLQERALALRLKGGAYFLMGSRFHGEAVANLRQALELNRRNPAESARCLLNLVGTYCRMGDEVTARRYCDHYLELCRLHPHPEVERWRGRVLLNMGMVYADLDRPVEAEAYLRPAVAYFNTVDHPEEAARAREKLGITLCALTQALVRQGRVTEAAAALAEARTCLAGADNEEWASRLQAELCLAAGDFGGAREALLEAASHPAAEDNSLAEVLFLWARLEAQEGNLAGAVQYSHEALEVGRRALNMQLVHHCTLFLRSLPPGAPGDPAGG